LIVIRKAVPNDEYIIKEILQKTGFLPSSNNNTENTMVIETEDSIAGCGALDIFGDIAILKYLSVLPEYRSQGLGDGLTRALVNYADRRSIKKIYLFLKKPVNYFKRFGFKKVCPQDIQQKFAALNIYNTDPIKFAHIMELDIEDFFNNPQCHC
jgi:amino-acid N-acetyltransferase